MRLIDVVIKFVFEYRSERIYDKPDTKMPWFEHVHVLCSQKRVLSNIDYFRNDC